MPQQPSCRSAGRIVVAHVPHADENASGHERACLLGFAARIAALCGDVDGGWYDPSARYDRPLFFVPGSTLTHEEAKALGISGPDDLFGGVVPHAFVATKAISHGLVTPGARAIAGWNPDLGKRLAGLVLPGYTAFDLACVRLGGDRLLAQGRVRVKPVRACGGHGQEVAHCRASLHALIDALDRREVQEHGVVLELDLDESATFSVGQVRIGSIRASYVGTQRTTPNNHGATVYGGSDLTVARGGFEALQALDLPPEMAAAIAQAGAYDAAVRACYPGLHVTRSNYDVLLGRDGSGGVHSAVLEQSWRVGGATGAELAALERFQADPGLASVKVSCHEVFGDGPAPPPGAMVTFRGDDARAGRLVKYTVVHAA